MSEEKQLPAISITEEMAPAIYKPNGLDQFFEQIKEAVANEVPDLSTKKGRDRIASLAAQVSRSKTAVEKPGRDYLRRLKEAVKPAEQEIKRFVDACDQLRDAVRLPLTEFENAEKQRVADLQQRLSALREIANVVDEFGNVPQAEEIAARLESVKATAIDDSWQEVTAEAGVAKDAAITKLEVALKAAQQREAEAKELERLRVEQAEAAQREREAQIKREAEERARKEAEEKTGQNLKQQPDVKPMRRQQPNAQSKSALQLNNALNAKSKKLLRLNGYGHKRQNRTGSPKRKKQRKKRQLKRQMLSIVAPLIDLLLPIW